MHVRDNDDSSAALEVRLGENLAYPLGERRVSPDEYRHICAELTAEVCELVYSKAGLPDHIEPA